MSDKKILQFEKKESQVFGDSPFFKSLISVSRLIPLAYLCLLCYSCLGLFIYYRKFSIPIFSLISLEELVLFSLNDIPNIIYALIVVWVLTFIVYILIRLISVLAILLKKFKVIRAGKFDIESIRLGDYNVTLSSFVIWTGLIAILVVAIDPFSTILNWILILFNLSISALVAFYLKNDSSVQLEILMYLIIAFQFQALHKSFQAQGIKEDGNNISIELISSNKNIKTDSIATYIGKTKRYVLIYDRSVESSKVIGIADNDELIFTRIDD